MEAIPGLLAMIALVLANGFFVASELSIVSVRRSRIEQLVAEGNPLARAVQRAQANLPLYIAASQLGITMASLALGWVAEPALGQLLHPLLVALPFLPAEGREAASHSISVLIAFAIVTALHIVLGELAPKSLALQRTEAIALFVQRPLSVFIFLFRLPISVISALGMFVLRALRLRPPGGEELVHSVEELRLLVAGSHEAGVLDETEAEIVTRVLGFHELAVREVMVPRTELQALPVTATLDDVIRLTAMSGHSRFPVYEGDLDHVLGVLHLKDLFAVLEKGTPERFELRPLVRDVLVVPDSLPVDTLLLQPQREQRSVALVVDEFGGVAGLVTLQDVLERIVGEFGDEFEAARPAVQPQPDGTVLIDGLARIEDVARECRLPIRPEDTEEAETMGGLVMLRLGRVPAVGDEVALGEATLRVERMDGRRVEVLRLRRPASPNSRGSADSPQPPSSGDS
jgi:putative hemolysin